MSSHFSTLPKKSRKKLNILRTKTDVRLKQKAIFHLCQRTFVFQKLSQNWEWAFKYSVLSNVISLSKNIKVSHPKLWTVRCSTSILVTGDFDPEKLISQHLHFHKVALPLEFFNNWFTLISVWHMQGFADYRKLLFNWLLIVIKTTSWKILSINEKSRLINS